MIHVIYYMLSSQVAQTRFLLIHRARKIFTIFAINVGLKIILTL